LNKVCDVLNAEQIQHFFIPVLKRLSMGDWFTSRSSATGLYAIAYAKCPAPVQEELKK
jgi:serine/threonine-protein phosphatase 2A regulatory subunit A